METNTAEITALEIKDMDFTDKYCLQRVLIKKGLKAENLELIGTVKTWHDRVTGTYHYFQEIK